MRNLESHGLGPPGPEPAPPKTTPSHAQPAFVSTPKDVKAKPAGYIRPRHFPWADLLRRIFPFDILACGECGGRLRLVSTIVDPTVIAKILNHLGLPSTPPVPEPARAPPWLPGLAEQ